VLIAVTDSGEGIQQDLLAKVFEPFFTTKEVGQGSGLGLSMVYGFVKQSNGHVSIYSEPSLGTTVRIYLPEAPGGAASSSDPAEADVATLPTGTETVLVVEDDALVSSYLVTSLTSLGYQVIAARDGSEALQQLRSEIKIDLMFTDIIMPGRIKGWKLAELARECRPGLPVVLTSGYALETLIERGSSAADLVILTKPYRKSELAHCLRGVFDTTAAATMVPVQ
jgi:CheY-like chemotaxis protein